MVGNVPEHVSFYNYILSNYNYEIFYWFNIRPGTDTLAIFVSNTIHGQVIKNLQHNSIVFVWFDFLKKAKPDVFDWQDDRGRLMRRTIMRYVNLSYIMILTMVSTRVKKRFPTLEHLVEAGTAVLLIKAPLFNDNTEHYCFHRSNESKVLLMQNSTFAPLCPPNDVFAWLQNAQPFCFEHHESCG